MASVRTEALIEAAVDDVWAVIRDFATGPARMAPGFVADSHADSDVRTVTFADGTVVRERFVAIDDAERRIVYSVVRGGMCPEHDNATMRVEPDGVRRSRFVWVHDVLPDDLAPPILAAMKRGTAVIKRTLESGAA
jgi:hypothetical protein